MHKFLNGNGPPECINMFRYVHEVHQINTRNAHGDLLYIEPTRLVTSERDFAIEGPQVWNQIPLDIRKIGAHKEFKNQIKTVTFM